MRSGSDDENVLQAVEKLKDRLETVDLGDAKFLLGMGIHRNVHAGTIILPQETYDRTIQETYGMADARPTKTPAEAGPMHVEEDEILSTENTTLFKCATGSLLYLSRCTRPDITHAVMVLTRSMSKPGPRAMINLKRVLRYLKGRTSIGLTYSEDAENGDELTEYVDLDHAGDMDKGYSTTRVVVCLAGTPID